MSTHSKKPSLSVRVVLAILVLVWGLWCVETLLANQAHAFATKKAEPKSQPAAAQTQTPQADRTWVTHADGTLQCEDSKGKSVDEDKAILEKKGITVFEAKKMNDGKMRAQMCGIDTGNHNLFLIPTSQVAKAVALGFAEAKSAQ